MVAVGQRAMSVYRVVIRAQAPNSGECVEGQTRSKENEELVNDDRTTKTICSWDKNEAILRHDTSIIRDEMLFKL